MELTENKNIKKDTYAYLLSKRCIDIAGGIVGSILAIVIIFIVKIISILSGDHYPVVFKQERIGINGKPIVIYKIRSMIPDADNELYRLMASNPDIKEEYTKNKKLKNDPRITKIGKVIRKNSLDEFPQFFNVLQGDMSLVGPRPYLPREREDMSDAYNEIIKVKPGITGPWQIGGRSDTSFKARIAYDVGYVQHHNISSDIRILWKTVFNMNSGAV